MIVNSKNYSIEHFHESNFVHSNTDKLSEERLVHLEESLTHVGLHGAILEFGVWSGTTINVISKYFQNNKIHGFDSFEGLPEDWNISYNEKHNKHKKGYFSVDTLPQVNSNVKLWKGWFDATIDQYLEQHKDIISFLHVDCDLYSSTKTVFDKLNDYIVKDTIITFDEFYPWGRKRYETWAEHEYKALGEWVKKYNRSFIVLSHNNHQQTTIKIVT